MNDVQRAAQRLVLCQQFRDVLPAASLRRQQQPLAHQLPAPTIVQRPTAAYDALYGVEGWR